MLPNSLLICKKLVIYLIFIEGIFNATFSTDRSALKDRDVDVWVDLLHFKIMVICNLQNLCMTSSSY